MDQGIDEVLPSELGPDRYLMFVASPVTLSLCAIDNEMAKTSCAYVEMHHVRANVTDFESKRNVVFSAIKDLLATPDDHPKHIENIRRAMMFITWLAWNDPNEQLRKNLPDARWIAFCALDTRFSMMIGNMDEEYEETRDQFTRDAQIANAEMEPESEPEPKPKRMLH